MRGQVGVQFQQSDSLSSFKVTTNQSLASVRFARYDNGTAEVYFYGKDGSYTVFSGSQAQGTVRAVER